MIKLVCDNPLIYRTISSYLSHKNILISSKNDVHQIVIKIYENEKYIYIDIDEDKIELSLPADINTGD